MLISVVLNVSLFYGDNTTNQHDGDTDNANYVEEEGMF